MAGGSELSEAEAVVLDPRTPPSQWRRVAERPSKVLVLMLVMSLLDLAKLEQVWPSIWGLTKIRKHFPTNSEAEFRHIKKYEGTFFYSKKAHAPCPIETHSSL